MPIRIGGRDYLEHTTLDFEFIAKGNVPEVVSLVAYETVSGKWHRYLGDELRRLKQPPFPVDDHSLVSGFPFMSESDCFRSLGWPQPRNVFCLFSTYRRLTNGLQARGQKANGLIAALTYYGETSMAQNAKESMHELILRGGHTSDELRQILIYNEEDVAANRRLYPHFIPEIDDPSAWSQVLFYGEGAKAWSQLQCAGIPIDDDTLSQLLKYWDLLKRDLIEEVDSKFHVFLDGHFKSELFDKYLRDNIIRWPRLDSGRLRLDDETFRDMAELHPRLMPLHQLRTALSKMRLTGLTIGSDGRNRFQYWPLSAITCRCGASNRENIFGPSNWMRYLVRSLPGKSLAYIDWSQQEFLIQGFVSQDRNMLASYAAGDAYLNFAALANPGMSGKQLQLIRPRYKRTTLGLGYGMGVDRLAIYVGCTRFEARLYRAQFWQLFAQYARWRRAVVRAARTTGMIQNISGWPLHISKALDSTTIANFEVQSAGFELLRLALIRILKAGIRVIATLHDAFLIEADDKEIEEAVHETKRIMAGVSCQLLGGLELRSEDKIVRYPERLGDERGTEFWGTVIRLLKRRGAIGIDFEGSASGGTI